MEAAVPLRVAVHPEWVAPRDPAESGVVGYPGWRAPAPPRGPALVRRERRSSAAPVARRPTPAARKRGREAEPVVRFSPAVPGTAMRRPAVTTGTGTVRTGTVRTGTTAGADR